MMNLLFMFFFCFFFVFFVFLTAKAFMKFRRCKFALCFFIALRFNPYRAKQKLQQTTLTVIYFNLSKKIRLDVSCESSA